MCETGVLGGTAGCAVGLAHFVGGIACSSPGSTVRTGDGFGGTAFAGLGAFWLTWAAGVGAGGGGKHAAGLFLLLCMLALTLAAASWHSRLLGRGVYGLLTLSLLLAAIGTFAGSGVWVEAAGWVAAVSGLISWYWATAALTQALPVK